MASPRKSGARAYSIRLGAIAFTLLVATGAGPVRAQGDALEQRCAASDGKAEDRIAACTALIEAGRARGPELATLRLRRANALSEAREFARAAADAREALRLDPTNENALERAFLASLSGGDFVAAVGFAERLARSKPSHRMARLVLGVQAIKGRQYAAARPHLSEAGKKPITDRTATVPKVDITAALLATDLTATLLTAWVLQGEGQTRAAIDAIDKLKGADWYEIFKDFHAGLIFDLAGQNREAAVRLSRAHDRDSTALRVVEAYGRLIARAGSHTHALNIFENFDNSQPRNPLVLDAIEAIKARKRLSPLVDSVETGAAEVLYGVGGSLKRKGEDHAYAYLQLALALAPRHSLALMSLADLYEKDKKPRLAIETYLRVPADSLLKFNAELQRAVNLNDDGRVDDAVSMLERLIAERPRNFDAGMTLGNVLRMNERFAACAEAYSRGIAALDTPRRGDWLIFYFRGICHERNHQWAKAEPDLKKALELYPDQPHVLNYLGYSWVDRGIHLGEGMQMIRRAVEQRPDDGYIVDSLGWGLYQLGWFDEALRHLKRAIDLRPDDPTITDHLGDVLWKLGRREEARTQWQRASTLKPAPEDLKRIEEKLQSGIAEPPAPAVTVNAPPTVASAPPSDAGRRIALVIGNSAYKNVPALLNPLRDAKAVAGVLGRIGFQEVVFHTDVGKDALLEALRRFAAKAEKADWAVIYFAGHGIEMSGTNYLIPVDARLATDRDVELETVPLDRVMTATEGARKLRLVLLDACRNNPFIPKMQTTAAAGSVGRAAPSGSPGKGRSISPGLAELSPEAGTLVVFAAKHGKEALDGEGENSPFVAAIVKRLPTPGLEVRRLFDVVRDDVLAATGRQQQPFTYGSLPGSIDFFFVRGK